MEQKIRGFIAYCTWIGAVVTLVAFKDNDSRTKFNAFQSIVLTGSATLVGIILGWIPVIKYLAYVYGILMVVLSVVGMLKAYQEEDYELPFVSDFTRDIFKKQLD